MTDPVKDGGSGERAALLRSAGLISLLTLASRVLGLVREQAFAALLGAGMLADAFQIAFRIPNLLRDLFAEGALSAAFVPTYTRLLTHEGRPAAFRFASRLFTLLTIVLAGVVVIGVIFTPQIVAALAPGYGMTPGKTEITVLLTRTMMPFLPLVSLAAIAMGMLNAEQRYSAPALAPALFNVVAIAWAAGLWALGCGPRAVAIGWAIGTLLGGLAQFVGQLPELMRLGYRFRPEWLPGDKDIREVLTLMAPATFGLAAVQINLFMSSRFASHEPSAVSWLNYAFRILYLPIGVFGVAAGTIAATGLARRVSQGDHEGLGQTLRASLRLVAFLTIPAMVGLITLAEPIVRLLYERGRFTALDTHGTAAALALYALGLVGYSSVKVLAPAFYALGRPRVPLFASLLAVTSNLVMILALYERFGFGVVALGQAVGAMANSGLLMLALERRLRVMRGHGLAWAGARMLVAALLMIPVCSVAYALLAEHLGTRGLLAQSTTALVPVVLGMLVYLAVARVLRLQEVDTFVNVVRARLRRRAA
jgi:putative peptidoglycan lipid II flippase